MLLLDTTNKGSWFHIDGILCKNRVSDFMRCSRQISFLSVLNLVIDRPMSLNVHPVMLCKHLNTNSMSVYICLLVRVSVSSRLSRSRYGRFSSPFIDLVNRRWIRLMASISLCWWGKHTYEQYIMFGIK